MSALAEKIAREIRVIQHPNRCTCGGCESMIRLMTNIIDRVLDAEMKHSNTN